MRFLAKLVLVLAVLAMGAVPAFAGEEILYSGESGFSKSFTLAGGAYSIYVHANFVRNYKTHSPDSCVFVGNFQRVSPGHDEIQLGSSVPIVNPVPYKLGPAPLRLPAGRYRLYVASTTDCSWRFSLEGR